MTGWYRITWRRYEKNWPKAKGRFDPFFQHLGFHEEVPESRLFFPTAEEVIAGVCAHFQVTKEQIAVSRRGAENLPRDVAIYLVRLLGRDTLGEVGKHFGMSKLCLKIGRDGKPEKRLV